MKEIETAIKLQLPWADELAKGKIPILLRTFKTNIRGTLGIVASQGFDRYSLSRGYNPDLYNDLYGNLIGTIEIIKVHKIPKKDIQKRLSSDVNNNFAKWYPINFIPPDYYVYFWYLKNPNKFKEPFHLKRRSGYVWYKFNSEERKKMKNLK